MPFLQAKKEISVLHAPKKKPRFLREVWKYRFLFMLMLPILILLILTRYLPMFGVLIAFKDINYRDGIFGSPWVGFSNFEFLFSSNVAWEITRNTVLYNAVFIVTTLVVSVSFAIGLNEMRNRLAAKFYQSALFYPFFLSMVVVSYLVYAFLGPEGLMNSTILPFFGIEPISWYNEAKYWPFILPIVELWKGVGYSTIIYLAAIVGIDEEYYEAAIMDGASKWQQIMNITIPLIRPVIVILFLLAVSKIFNADFGLFYQVTLNSGPLFPTTNVIDTYVYRALIQTQDVGMSAAAGLYQAVVGFVLVLSANYIVKKINKEDALF